MRTVGEAEVVVMKGEYSYIGVDGNEWKVSRTHIVFITLVIIVMKRLNGTPTRQASTQVPLSSPSLLSQTTQRLLQR